MRLHSSDSKSRRRFADLAMAKDDRGRSQNRTGNKERKIGQKQWQQHQGEAAKHGCPILHPFAVSENDEAEGAEDDAGDTIHYERGGHRPSYSLSQAKRPRLN
jgi:hypothetical protein